MSEFELNDKDLEGVSGGMSHRALRSLAEMLCYNCGYRCSHREDGLFEFMLLNGIDVASDPSLCPFLNN